MKIKGFFRSDGDGHNYFVPSEKVEEFDTFAETMCGMVYMDNPDAFDEFNGAFSQYRIDGIEDIEVECESPY